MRFTQVIAVGNSPYLSVSISSVLLIGIPLNIVGIVLISLASDGRTRRNRYILTSVYLNSAG